MTNSHPSSPPPIDDDAKASDYDDNDNNNMSQPDTKSNHRKRPLCCYTVSPENEVEVRHLERTSHVVKNDPIHLTNDVRGDVASTVTSSSSMASFVISSPSSITAATNAVDKSDSHSLRSFADDTIGSSSKGTKHNDPSLRNKVPLQGDFDLHQDDDDDEEEEDDRTSKDYYFDSYSHHAIHEEMLKDEVRTRTFQMAILNNRHLFQDKIVLDVGCGTGILSMFAAQAGAKHVYGVDCSSIVEQARQIVAANGLADRITLIKGKMEEIDLPVPTVDVIVSEWMGYFLLYESMLDTVLYARDRWLVPHNGVIFPDKAVMYICAAEDGHVKQDRIDFWHNVYGFDMTALKEIALKEPVVDVIDSRQIVTGAVPILRLDILTCTKDELLFRSDFTIRALREDRVHALVAFFECAFTQGHSPIGFSTSPFARYTHWKQTLLYLRDAIPVRKGQSLSGEISCRPNSRNRRDLDIDLVLSIHDQSVPNDDNNDRKNHPNAGTRIQMNYRLR